MADRVGGRQLNPSVRRAWLPSVAVLVLALTVTACTAVGTRLVGASQPQPPAGADLDALVVPAGAAAGPEAAPPSAAGDVAITEAPETFTGAVRLRPPPAQLRGRATGKQSGTWAVVIGINDYPGTDHDLRSAVPDAEEVNRALSVLGVPTANRLVITDGQATARVISAAADWLVDRAGPDAVAVFVFAGHVKKLSGTTEAMVGADGRTVTDAELARRLAGLQARRLWVAMAACFGGGFTEVLRPGVVLTGAAGANDRAYENSAFNRSYMVEYMVRQAMVEGRASESVQAAFRYARDALARDFPHRVPEQVDRAVAPIDLRPPGFTPAPRAWVSPAPTPSQDAPATGNSGSGGGSNGSTPPPPTTTTTAPCRIATVLRCPGSTST